MAKSDAETILSPLMTFRFEVVFTLHAAISGVEGVVCDAAFQECSGLDMTMEPKTLTQGGDHQRQIHRIGPVSYGRLTLRRGMTSNHHLWYWFAGAAIPGKDAGADAEIKIRHNDGSEAVTFVLDDCLPVKVSGPSLNATNGQIAIEEMQLVYAHLTLKGQGQGGFGISASIGFSAGVSAGLSASAGISLSGGPGLSGGASAKVSGGFKLG